MHDHGTSGITFGPRNEYEMGVQGTWGIGSHTVTVLGKPLFGGV